ncbi:AMP-binding protein [Amycolatopsis pithecellobii]|uniref:AMP-binding protein n=1 Tax=Amycolatopsis pithecellobii TaxID=664692 RepID=A0A6N7Z1Q2_9PSEU|nr:AMP-binding protein [Amycolatopsis pithecellobii]MTD54739.1 AMP-binding protein [Amycolatopsis pithecellobii]
MYTQDSVRRPLNTVDFLVNALNQNSSRPLLHLSDGETLTVGQTRDSTSQYVQALTGLGVGEGTRVALVSSNLPEVLHAAHATQIVGGVYIPLHPMGSRSDHLNIVGDAEVEWLIFEGGAYDARAAELAAAVPGLKLVALGWTELAEDLRSLAGSMRPQPLKAPMLDPAGIERISYSGGTTGKPKSMASRRATSAALWSIMLAEWEWPRTPRVLSCAPLSHAGGTMFLPTLLKYGTILIHPGFDPLAVLQAIQDYQINCMMLVPTMIYALLDHPRFEEFDLSSLETIFYGASAMSPVRLKEAIERIGPVFFQFYGQAEAPMTVTVLRKAEHDVNNLERLSSCGRPVPWLLVELLDSENRPVPEGEPGEICVRGPIVMDGYRDNPELNAEVFSGGWLHTGDVAIRDADGFLRIVDRKKDMIVSGGFNIYPREIEDTLALHPAVAQSAVIGVPHPKWGEAVKALVVLKPGQTATAEELIALVAERKGRFQAPKGVEFISAIPNTAVGKPDKKALRARHGSL